jgi:hypothetical protein
VILAQRDGRSGGHSEVETTALYDSLVGSAGRECEIGRYGSGGTGLDECLGLSLSGLGLHDHASQYTTRRGQGWRVRQGRRHRLVHWFHIVVTGGGEGCGRRGSGGDVVLTRFAS